jgi:hypothetical protein
VVYILETPMPEKALNWPAPSAEDYLTDPVFSTKCEF